MPFILASEAPESVTSGWTWFEENGILESLQLGILILILVRYLILAKRHDTVLRALFLGAALVTAACILREADFRPSGTLSWIDGILKGPARWAIVALAIPLGIHCVRSLLADPRAVFRLVVGNRWGRIAALGALLLLGGALYDRGAIPSPRQRAWEEVLETIGYLLIAISTIIPHRVALAALSKHAHADDRTDPRVDEARTCDEYPRPELEVRPRGTPDPFG